MIETNMKIPKLKSRLSKILIKSSNKRNTAIRSNTPIRVNGSLLTKVPVVIPKKGIEV